MRTVSVRILLLCAPLLLVACGQPGEGEPVEEAEPAETAAAETPAVEAMATIEAKSGSGVSGTARFSYGNGVVTLHLEVAGATPGEHAFHLHETGDCSAADGTSAGGHWNPRQMDHGKLGEGDQFHYGDTGNLTVGEDGSGWAHVMTDLWSIGTGDENDILGKAVIIHAGADDFVSQPTGAAGGRIGCGVIE